VENLFVEKCLQKLEEKANQGPASEWTDGTFSALSDSIAKETKILISKNTLKRLFGKMKRPLDYSPQRQTKNALAQFAGYKDWADFLSLEFGSIVTEKAEDSQESIQKIGRHWTKKGTRRVFDEGVDGTREEELKVYDQEGSWKRKSPNWSYVLTTTLIALACSILVMLVKENAKQAELNSIEIVCKNPNDTVPGTFNFVYDLKNVKDSIFIITTEGEAKYLPPDLHLFNSYQSFPAPDHTRLQTKSGRIVKRVPTYGYSRGWVGTATLGNLKPRFLIDEKTLNAKPGRLQVDMKAIKARGIDTVNMITHIRNMHSFPVDGNDFVFDAEVLGEGTYNLEPCHSLRIRLYFSNNNIELSLHEKTCQRFVYLAVSEKIFDGRYNDLFAFATGLGTWQKVRVVTKDMKASIYLGGVKVFESDYSTKLGPLRGIGLKGENVNVALRSIRFGNNKGKELYKRQF